MTPHRPDSHRLPNGLRVIAVEMPHLHTAAVQLYVKVGSRFESPADSGLSHFLEHMLFRGTRAHPSSYALNFAIERLGGTLDAETGRDCSVYPLAIAPDDIDEAIGILAEVVARPRFDDLELERELILEELTGDFDEGGVEVAADEIGRRLVFGDHPLGQRITGPRENIERFGIDDVRRHHGRFYTGANIVLAVAGPVDAARVHAAAERHLGALPPGEPAVVVPPTGDQDAPRYAYVDQPGSQTDVFLAFRALPEFDPRYMASVALLRVLDDGMATRLHYRLCDQLGLAYSIGATLEPLHDVTLLEIDSATANAKVADLLRGIRTLLAELAGAPCARDELDKVKRRYGYDVAAARDDPFAMASWYGSGALYGEPPTLAERLAQMQAVSEADVRDVAAQILRPERFSAVVVGRLGRVRQAEVREIATRWT